jgi:hypothetical protein
MFLLNILILVSLESQGVANQNDFIVLKNQDLNVTVNETSLISSVFKPSRMQCMTMCSSDPNCLTAVYDNNQGSLTNCFIYRRFFETNELISSSTGVVFQKKSLSESKIYLI